MRHVLPVMTEHAESLKQRLQRERDSRKKSRLQMLYLLASGQAQTRQDVAQLLGVHRNTVGHWLARYATGGLAGPPRASGQAHVTSPRRPGCTGTGAPATRRFCLV